MNELWMKLPMPSLPKIWFSQARVGFILLRPLLR